MKQKIKEALQQEYKNLGLNDEVFEQVASSVEMLVTEDTLANFVQGAKGVLTKFQSVADKARGEASAEKKRAEDLQAKLAEAEAKLAQAKPKEEKPAEEKPDFEKLFEEKLNAIVNPLMEKLEAFEGSKAADDAVNAARKNLFGNKYAEKYTAERDLAWKNAMKNFERLGKKMTAEELTAEATGYFNELVSIKGVDTSKPFEGEGGSGNKPDFSEQKKMLQEQGLLPSEEK